MKIKTATVMIKTERIGNSVMRKKVTPAELMYLVSQFHHLAGGDPVMWLKEDEEEIELSAATEKRRLVGKYGSKVKSFFPGALPQLPETFDEARRAGVGSEMQEGVMDKFMATTSNLESVV